MAATPASPKNALGRKRMSNVEYSKIAYSKQANQTLDEIREQIADCKKCPLWETRTNIVFGGPNPTARIMIVGEAPGKNEDLSGQPFVGTSGKKLDALLEEVGLSRQDVFISNVVKCRPPSNRNPKVAEV